jgi:hypothetical protein
MADVWIAHQIVGDGPFDVDFLPGCSVVGSR